jgi:hypothetical protein
LRDLHSKAVSAGISGARRSGMQVVALLGHPGIGKTTSVVETLRGGDGCLFAYFSPRVIINGGVTAKIVEKFAPGTLALTTNAQLIKAAPNWAKANGIASAVHSAIVVECSGAAVLSQKADGGCLHLSPQEGQEVTEKHHGASTRGTDVAERMRVLNDTRTPGVLRTLAFEARRLADFNPQAPTIAITAATQGFRLVGGTAKTTISGLSNLFNSKFDSKGGVRERAEFAKRFGTVVVMVDEITGDGAGAPMVHALADWLRQEFIEPFDGESPFKVVLILADASLSTPEAFRSYMDSAAGYQAENGEVTSWATAPRRVMISEPVHDAPFGLASGKMKLGGRNTSVLYVMADAYPANRLAIEYHVRLDTVDGSGLEEADMRRRLREEHGERMLLSAAKRVDDALRSDPEHQTIFFAQDKAFLRTLKGHLVERYRWGKDDIEIIDGSVDPSKRRLLMRPDERERKKAFLMTSAGGRGVDFPRAATIVIQVPQFDVESALMEIAQMIFRGRGKYDDPATGAKVDGDALDRRIVFMVEDYLRIDGGVDPRDWARHKIDLASIVLLLRATVETRIKGRHDGSFCGAVVPVGMVGLEVTSNTMTGAVTAFLKECQVAMAESGDESISKTARAAWGHGMQLFRNMHWRATDAFDSLAMEKNAVRYRNLVNSATAPLVATETDGVAAELPDQLYFIGPVVMEDWSSVAVTEHADFSVGAMESGLMKSFKGCCIALKENPRAPKSLKDTARDVLDIIDRPNETLRDVEFTASKELRASGRWLVLPADYSRFITERDSERDERATKLSAPDMWAGLMHSCASLHRRPTSLAPVVPEYDDKPFAGAVVFGDPTDIDRAFDDRYFMSTREFNLLNAILFPVDD